MLIVAEGVIECMRALYNKHCTKGKFCAKRSRPNIKWLRYSFSYYEPLYAELKTAINLYFFKYLAYSCFTTINILLYYFISILYLFFVLFFIILTISIFLLSFKINFKLFLLFIYKFVYYINFYPYFKFISIIF